MAKDRYRYPLVKKAYKSTKQHHPSMSVEQAYYAGAALILATVSTIVANHPDILDTLLPTSLESLHIETQNFLKKENLRDTFLA
jgi:hypothetical protein